MARLRVKLLGTTPSPLKEILVDRVIVTWLQVQHADYTYGKRKDDLSLAQLEHVEINVQINVARQQVVMGGSPCCQRQRTLY